MPGQLRGRGWGQYPGEGSALAAAARLAAPEGSAPPPSRLRAGAGPGAGAALPSAAPPRAGRRLGLRPHQSFAHGSSNTVVAVYREYCIAPTLQLGKAAVVKTGLVWKAFSSTQLCLLFFQGAAHASSSTKHTRRFWMGWPKPVSWKRSDLPGVTGRGNEAESYTWLNLPF